MLSFIITYIGGQFDGKKQLVFIFSLQSINLSINNNLNQGMEYIEKINIAPLGLTLIFHKLKISQGHKLKNEKVYFKPQNVKQKLNVKRYCSFKYIAKSRLLLNKDNLF